jgi:hypothetical protein
VFDRRFPILLALVGGASYLAIFLCGARGVAITIALFALVAPRLLSPLRETLRTEWAGALFLFLTACYADVLDEIFGTAQRFTSAILLLGVLYLIARRREVMAIVGSPIALLLGLFLAQQIASAWAFGSPDLLHTVENRASIYISFLAASTLARRPGGAQLFPGLVILAVLASVPVMVRELAVPDLLQAPVEGEAFSVEEIRSGGLYTQANNAGIALTYALGLALGAVEKRSHRLAIFAAIGIGIVCAASRGAFTIALVLLVGAWLLARMKTASRASFTATLLATACALAFLRPLARFFVKLTESVKESMPSIARLQEVLLAIGGSTETLADDDSRRSGIATAAWQMIGEKPLLGRGTGNFLIADAHGDLRSHVQFLEVLGENGAVGGVFYGGLLIAIGATLRKVPAASRLAAGAVCLAWFLTHFDNHNLMEYRFMILPIAFVCGVAR